MKLLQTPDLDREGSWLVPWINHETLGTYAPWSQGLTLSILLPTLLVRTDFVDAQPPSHLPGILPFSLPTSRGLPPLGHIGKIFGSQFCAKETNLGPFKYLPTWVIWLKK